jgi:diguanylate cyclase (GGDEF)-like protein
LGVAGGRGDDASRVVAALAAATSVAEAGELVVDHLEAFGLPLPSVYLEQGGRLRCLAQRGYWQVLDGVPCDVGVIGRSFRTGQTVEVTDASAEEEFLFAAPDLRCQVSVPIRHADQVVGTLNVESKVTLPAWTRELLEALAAAFGTRLEQLGGPPKESTAQLVARLATTMTALDDEMAVRACVIDAAVQVTGMPTAALIEPAGDEGARIVVAAGPLAEALEQVDPGDLGQLDRWVAAGSSLFARGTASSELDMHGRLRSAGVATLAVVPLTASRDHLGSLVVASERPQGLDAAAVSGLETLGAQAAASLLNVRTIAQLQERARTDPLTGIGHHTTFQEELRARLADRPADRRLAVLMIDIDDFKAVNDRHGHQAGDVALKQLSARLSASLRGDDRLYRVGGDEFATILQVAEASEAARIAARLRTAAQQGEITISVGIAIAHDDESAHELIDRADAAMYHGKGSGRDTVAIAARTGRG